MATAQTHSVDVNALPHIENISLPIGDAYRKLWT
jgi:hypothetical protein